MPNSKHNFLIKCLLSNIFAESDGKEGMLKKSAISDTVITGGPEHLLIIPLIFNFLFDIL